MSPDRPNIYPDAEGAAKLKRAADLLDGRITPETSPEAEVSHPDPDGVDDSSRLTAEERAVGRALVREARARLNRTSQADTDASSEASDE